jgi:co-chaperonin GroES (HSP10)
MAQPLQLLHSRDPGEEIVADSSAILNGFRIRPTDVLLVMYQREKIQGDKRTAGGIFIPDNGAGTLREDAYQGKVGVVMKVGSIAFTTDDDHNWGDFVPKPGDWVVVNVGDTFSFDLPNGRRARVVDENLVRAIIPQPDLVW